MLKLIEHACFDLRRHPAFLDKGDQLGAPFWGEGHHLRRLRPVGASVRIDGLHCDALAQKRGAFGDNILSAKLRRPDQHIIALSAQNFDRDFAQAVFFSQHQHGFIGVDRGGRHAGDAGAARVR